MAVVENLFEDAKIVPNLFDPPQKSSNVVENLFDEKPSTLGMLGQFAIGAGNALAFSVPEFLNKKEFDSLKSESGVERIARGAGTAVGSTVGLPGLVYKAGSKVAAKAAAKLIPELMSKSSKGVAIANEAIKGAGGMTAFTTFDPTRSIEQKIEDLPRDVILGAGIGATLHVLPSFIKNRLPKKTEEKIKTITSQPKSYDVQGNIIPSGRENLVSSMEKIIPKEAESVINQLQKSKIQIEAADRGLIPIVEQVKMSKGIKIDQSFYDNLKAGDVANTETNWALTFDLIEQLGKLSTNPKLAEQISKNFIRADALISENARALGARSKVQQVASEQLKYLTEQFKKLDPQAQEAAKKLFDHVKTPNFWDKFMEFRTAGLLSSPYTHERNIIGNLIPLITRPLERVFSGNINKVESLLTGRKQEIFSREAIGNSIGILRGMGAARKNFIEALKNEDFVSDSRIMEALKFKRSINGNFGKIIRSPFRFLNAADEFFYTLNNSALLYERATHQALKEGAEDFSGRVAELVKSPTPEMISTAARISKENLFKADLPGWALGFEKALQESHVGKYIIPFFRTPFNIFKYSFQHGPLGFASPKNWKDIVKGKEARSEGIARIMTGQIISTTVFLEAMQGNITGRLSSNKAKREAMMRQGMQPYSIKIGDKYISYRSFEPLSSWLGLVSNAQEILKETRKPLNPDKTSEIVGETLKMMKDQSFLQGLSDLTNALDDPERYGKIFSQNLVTSLIPSGVGYLARLHDPVIRDPDTLPKAIKSRLPYLSKTVEPKLDVWGRPITREGTLSQRAILPSGVMTSKPDFTEQELLSLDIFPQKILRSYNKLNLTVSERNMVTKVEGFITKDLLDKAVNSSAYKSSPIWEQEEALNEIKDGVRRQVRKVMLEDIKRERFKSIENQDDKLRFLEDVTRKKLIKE